MPTVSIKNTEQNRSWKTPTSAPNRCIELDQHYVSGVWRNDNEGSKVIDAAPCTGETLAEIVQVNKLDLDEGHQTAAKAQVSWGARHPAERATLMLRSSRIMEAFRNHVDRKDLSFKTRSRPLLAASGLSTSSREITRSPFATKRVLSLLGLWDH